MPLLDHFHPPLTPRWRWPSFHGAWATFIAQQLNDSLLPEYYQASPFVHLSGSAQIDVGVAREEDNLAEKSTSGANGGLATATWAPPKPTLVAKVDFTDVDVVEIEITSEEAEWRVVSAIELISPANKERPSHRQAFAIKCAALLQQQASVLVIDMVTERQEGLHQELMSMLKAEATPFETSLSAISYKLTSDGRSGQLSIWPHTLVLGHSLPDVPVWIAPDLAVRLDLDESYQSACRALRIPSS